MTTKAQEESAKLKEVFTACEASDEQADDVVKALKTELSIVTLNRYFIWFRKHDLKT